MIRKILSELIYLFNCSIVNIIMKVTYWKIHIKKTYF